jgi:hypothetical protein
MDYELSPDEAAAAGVISVSEIIRTTARAVAHNAPAFLVVTTICLLPAIALSAVSTLLVAQPDSLGAVAGGAVLSLGAGLLQMILTYLAQAAMLFTTIEFMAGRHAPLGQAVQKAFSRLLPVIGTALLVGLGTGIGFVLCFVPGLILALMWYVALPVTVVENVGPIEAMKRSSNLTDGRKGQIFLASLVFGLLIIALSSPAIVASFNVAAGNAEDAALPLGWAGFAWQQVVTIIQTIVFAALTGVVYVRLRGIREGVDADALAAVFS